MFYSHEILTDRKHGVATIWLVATLGSKSSLKKITRKAIMDVDVPNACSTITDPVAPMALRLQGNLLFGMSRVFSQQCAYILTDTQSLRDKMRGISVLLKELEIDPNVATTRPEQLNLQTNPGFSIDLDLGFDLSGFDVGASSNTEPSSLLSPRTLPSSQSTFPDYEQFLEPAVSLEYSPSHGVVDDFAFGLVDLEAGMQEDYSREKSERITPSAVDQGAKHSIETGDEGEVENLMEIAEDGTIIMRDVYDQGASLSDPAVDYVEASAEKWQEDDFELAADDGNITPLDKHTPQPHPDRGVDRVAANRAPAGTSSVQSPADRSEPGDAFVRESVEYTNANAQTSDEVDNVTGRAAQRTRKDKAVPFDNPAEVSNRILAEWNDHYVDFMRLARLEKGAKLSAAQAKRNAAYWVLDQGLGDVDFNFRDDLIEHPLSIFSGEALIDALTRPLKGPQIRKRPIGDIAADDVPGSQGSKRIRSGSDGPNYIKRAKTGSLEAAAADDNQGITFGEDEFDAEVGRDQQEPLSDHPSDMPWNVYASSRQGSARPGLSVAGASSSAGGRGMFDINISSSNMKRISQLVRESPLERRKEMLRSSASAESAQRGGIELGSPGLELDVDDEELDARLAGNPDEEFELYGPGAGVSTQDATTSQWVAETLEKEAFNFLEFLQVSLRRRATEDAGGTGDEGTTYILFEDLLPPENNTEIVAAQGLLHVLSLATKGHITVKQEDGFGSIGLSLVQSSATGSEH